MDDGTPFTHRAVVAGADATFVATAVAAVATAVAAHDGRWVRHGLGQLMLFGWADRTQRLLPVALCAAAVLLGLELTLRALLRRGRPAPAAALLLVAGATVAAHRRLLPWLEEAWPGMAHSLALARLHWTLIGHRQQLLLGAGVGALAAVRFLADLRPRALRPRVPWRAPVIASIAVTSLLGVAAWDRAALESAPGDNVVLIVLDTVSAQHLASHGYPRDTMPELEAWAARGRRYPQARSVAPWTLPAHASLFTGLLPIQHGATQEHVVLAERFDTLAERLQARGYRTFAAAGNPIVGHETQLDQGFERFLPTWRGDVMDAWGHGRRHVNEEALLHFLDGLGKGERFFAFLNYMDAHSPYDPPRSFDARMGVPPGARKVDQDWTEYYAGTNPLGPAQFKALRALYDAGLAALSVHLDSLLHALQARGLLDHTLVIVTADHGENVGDHGQMDHVFSLDEKVLRVPLFLLGAGVTEPAVDPRIATSVDVTATVLAAGGIPDSTIGGFDLRRAGPAPRRPAISEYYFPSQVLAVMADANRRRSIPRIRRYLRRMRAIDEGGWKLIWGSDGHDALYHLTIDPDQEHDLAASEPERVRALQGALEARLRQLVGPAFSLGTEPPPAGSVGGFKRLDDTTRKELRTLGYVQ